MPSRCVHPRLIPGIESYCPDCDKSIQQLSPFNQPQPKAKKNNSLELEVKRLRQQVRELSKELEDKETKASMQLGYQVELERKLGYLTAELEASRRQYVS